MENTPRYINIWRETLGRESQLLSSGAQWQDQKQQAQTEAKEFQGAWITGNTFICCETELGTGCPERLQNVPSLEMFKSCVPWSWTTCFRGLYLSREVGQDDLQKFLPTSTLEISFCCTLCAVSNNLFLRNEFLVFKTTQISKYKASINPPKKVSHRISIALMFYFEHQTEERKKELALISKKILQLNLWKWGNFASQVFSLSCHYEFRSAQRHTK